jgi:hypothetical protein
MMHSPFHEPHRFSYANNTTKYQKFYKHASKNIKTQTGRVITKEHKPTNNLEHLHSRPQTVPQSTPDRAFGDVFYSCRV